MDFNTVTPEELLGPLNEVEKKHAPKQLFIRGRSSLVAACPSVSLIGARKASNEGLRRAALLAKLLVREGITVVSGLAEGVDTAAHKSAIANGGQTIAVIGTPLDTCYPRSNTALQDEIGRQYLLISQFPSNSPTRPRNFPMRNRTMALLSDATVIIEAGEKSGALIQGWEALRLGRPLFILESLANNKALSWPDQILHYGAEVLTHDNFRHLLDVLPIHSRKVVSNVSF